MAVIEKSERLLWVAWSQSLSVSDRPQTAGHMRRRKAAQASALLRNRPSDCRKASARSAARRDINLSGQRRPALPSGGIFPVNPCQRAGLRAMTIHAAPSIITDRSPGRPAKATRTAADARARMSSG